jgi:uncharacterized SAM-binding protein YcdF (DUF218 family)
MNHLRRYVTATVLLLAAAAIFYGMRASLLPCAARWLDVGERPAKADYVLVLGGDVNVRPLVAAALVRAGLAKTVLVSHVDFPPGGDDGIVKPQHKTVCEVLRRRGVPEQNITVLGHRNRVTYDEATSLATYLSAAPQARVLVVTSNYHTRRARWIFRQVFGERMASISFVSAPVDSFSADNWWQNQEGFTTILGENIKILGSLLFYRPLTCAAGAMAAMICLLGMILLIRSRRTRAARASQHLASASEPSVVEQPG